MEFTNTRLLVKAKITGGNGDEIIHADDVGGVNLFLQSLFQQVDVSLNDAQVNQSARTYAYRPYIESLLSYVPQANSSQFTAALHYKNTADNKDRHNPDHAKAVERNYAFQKRVSLRTEAQWT